MEHLEFEIEISAPATKVWETMLQEETYKQWVAKSWPNSVYKGKWEQGEKMRFIGPDGSGTLAELVEVKPYQKVSIRHIAILEKNGVEDRTSDVAQNWIGITEDYTFAEHHDKTTLTVHIKTNPEWREMFEDGWPDALTELKRLTERQYAEA